MPEDSTEDILDTRIKLRGKIATEAIELSQFFSSRKAMVEFLLSITIPPLLQSIKATQSSIKSNPLAFIPVSRRLKEPLDNS